METNPHIRKLFEKFLDNSISKKEYSELLYYFGSDTSREQLRQRILELFENENDEKIISIHRRKIDETIQQARGKIQDTIDNQPEKNSSGNRFIPYIAAAALLVAGFFSYQYLTQPPKPQAQEIVSNGAEDIEPGKNRATLTLEGSNAILLSEEKSGITVGSDGISYIDGTKVTENKHVQYAVLSTPRKGQYQTILPDGTKVWLNAASSLRYPTAFAGNQRRVELQGEAYFEVSHDIQKPFIVETASQHLKVLGTSFNLNAYDNEPATVTTLITGSIELGRKEDKITKSVKPDQQAVLGSTKFTVTPVDVRPFIAWKEGEFRFNETPLHEALRQIERWYDVEVAYENIPKDIEIYAFIRRDKKLSSVLTALEQITGLKFTLRERRLTLME